MLVFILRSPELVPSYYNVEKIQEWKVETIKECSL